jgi:hypothetical protein
MTGGKLMMLRVERSSDEGLSKDRISRRGLIMGKTGIKLPIYRVLITIGESR